MCFVIIMSLINDQCLTRCRFASLAIIVSYHNLILAKIRFESKIALATVSSGIAATLLTGGRAMHGIFKIPPDLNAIVCNIKKTNCILQNQSSRKLKLLLLMRLQ